MNNVDVHGNHPVEMIDIVDENDVVIGTCERGEAHRKFLKHRFTRIFVFNSKGEIILFLRANNPRDYAANKWDSAGGHITAGEDYATSAQRELAEEYGIDVESLTEIGKCDVVVPAIENMFGRIFVAEHDGPYAGDAEVAEIKACDYADVVARFTENPTEFSLQLQHTFPVLMAWKEAV